MYLSIYVIFINLYANLYVRMIRIYVCIYISLLSLRRKIIVSLGIFQQYSITYFVSSYNYDTR